MMDKTRTKVCGLSLIFFCAALPALADTEFRVRQMTRNDVPLGKGQCDIRLQIDGEAEVAVRGDTVYIRTISGRNGRDDGSECNAPLPGRNLRGFNYEVRESRGEIRLLSPPSGRDGAAVVRIRDSKGGEGRYHFRLSWEMTGGGDYRPDRFGEGDRRPIPPGNVYGEGDRRDRPFPPAGNSFTVAQAINTCQDAVRETIGSQYRYREVDFREGRLDDRPGRNDFIIGEAVGRRGNSFTNFTYFCRVDFSSGRVRSVDVKRR